MINEIQKEKKYKLIDYPHCAICMDSEQYEDDTFVCMYGEGELNYDPEPIAECEIFDNPEKIGVHYLSGFLELLINKIKDLEKEINKLKED